MKWSPYCQEHSCLHPRNKITGFCRRPRNPSNRYCARHGKCRASGCKRKAALSEKEPYPYLCPRHRCSKALCFKPRSGRLDVCEVHKRTLQRAPTYFEAVSFQRKKDDGSQTARENLPPHHQHVSEICDGVREMLSYHATDEQHAQNTFKSGPANVNQEITEPSGAVTKTETGFQSSGSSEQDREYEDAKQDSTSIYIDADAGFDGKSFALSVTG